MKYRKLYLAVMFFASLVAVFWTAVTEQNPPLEISSAYIKNKNTSALLPKQFSDKKSTDLLTIRDPLPEATQDPFKVVSFIPPPPPQPVAPPQLPTKPVAPPFPYSYFGRMVDVNGNLAIYLQRAGDLIPVEENKILDDAYKVTSITDNQISVIYLPLSESYVISIQSAKN